MTIQYPEEKVPVYPRFRGATSSTASRTPASRSASAARCARPPARPTASASSPPRTRPSTACRAGERYAAVYEINLSRCIFCGYCEVACPFDAITMGHDFELSDYNRSDLIFTKEMLLAEPLERTPLRARGRVASRAAWPRSSSSSPRIGAIAGASARRAAQPLLRGARARRATCSALAALFLLLRAEFVAAAQVVVYAGAVMVLYVFVVAYVGGATEPLTPHRGPGLRAFALLFAGALFVELAIAVLGSGLSVLDRRAPATSPASARRRRSASCS